MLLVGAMLALAADGSTLLRRHLAGGAYEALAELSSRPAPPLKRPREQGCGLRVAACSARRRGCYCDGDEDVESGTAGQARRRLYGRCARHRGG